MLKNIANLMDLPETKITLLLEEFKHKYIGTVLEIKHKNKEKPEFGILENITTEFIIFNTGYMRLDEMEYIKEFIPETGLYEIQKNLYYLTRIPARQFSKSLKLGVNYRLTAINIINDVENPITGIDIALGKYLENTTIFNNKLYFYWYTVGKVLKTKIVLFNKFKSLLPELTEIWKQYKITLDTPSQKDYTIKKDISTNDTQTTQAKIDKMILEMRRYRGLNPQIRPMTDNLPF